MRILFFIVAITLFVSGCSTTSKRKNCQAKTPENSTCQRDPAFDRWNTGRFGD